MIASPKAITPRAGRGEMKRVPLAKLVEDDAIYPRHHVDEAHIARLTRAIKGGAALPPIIVEAESLRVVDGRHRLRAFLRVLGTTGSTFVEVRRYPDRKLLLQDAVALNASHGRRLDERDLTRCVLMLDEAGLSHDEVLTILSEPSEKIISIRARVAVVSGSGQVVALKRPLVKLFEGKEMTPQQAEAHESAPGNSYSLLVRQLRDAITNDFLDPEDEVLTEALRRLHTALGAYLNRD